MPISCLNCCRGGGDKGKGKQPGAAANDANGNVSAGAQDAADGGLRVNAGSMPCAEEEGRDDEPVYAVVAKDRSGRLVPVPGSDGKKAKKGEFAFALGGLSIIDNCCTHSIGNSECT